MMRVLWLLFLFTKLFGGELFIDPPMIWPSCSLPCFPAPVDPITFTISSPTYEGSVFSTDQGGVIQSNRFRIQARCIRYTRKLTEENPVHTIECEKDILFDYCGQIIIAERLFFDLNTSTGYAISAQTSYFPWRIGAKTLIFQSDGTIRLLNGFVTTSEGGQKTLSLDARQLKISDRVLKTSGVNLSFFGKSLFFLPNLQVDLTKIKRPIFQFEVGWGGYLGPHVGIRYHMLSFHDLKAALRLDGYLHHGVGVGIDTSYQSSFIPLDFYTLAFWAHDLAIDNPIKRDRYRFRGNLLAESPSGKTLISSAFDKTSDAKVAADFRHNDFKRVPAQRTFFQLHHEEPLFLTNFLVDIRVNSFQSVSQRLPSLDIEMHPLQVGQTPFIFENFFSLSNINFVSSHDLVNPSTFHSGRLELRPYLYLPLHLREFLITPDIGLIAIGYTNSPHHNQQALFLARMGAEFSCSFYNKGCFGKHIIRPTLRYTHLTPPTSSLNNHFIFTIQDGYARFDQLRFGLENLFYFPFSISPMKINLWANAFFHPLNKTASLPKGYLDIELPIACLTFTMQSGIYFPKNTLDFFNALCRWSLSENDALSLEFRYRGAYAWRKADFFNFLLDTTRPLEELLASPLSDPRTTWLLSLFHRFNPDLNCTLFLRQGSHKKQKNSSYFEYELDVEYAILDHFYLKGQYEKRVADHRFDFSLKLIY